MLVFLVQGPLDSYYSATHSPSTVACEHLLNRAIPTVAPLPPLISPPHLDTTSSYHPDTTFKASYFSEKELLKHTSASSEGKEGIPITQSSRVTPLAPVIDKVNRHLHIPDKHPIQELTLFPCSVIPNRRLMVTHSSAVGRTTLGFGKILAPPPLPSREYIPSAVGRIPVRL